MFLRQVLGVCSIRIFEKNISDPYYEPTIVVHDTEPSSNTLIEQSLLLFGLAGVQITGVRISEDPL